MKTAEELIRDLETLQSEHNDLKKIYNERMKELQAIYKINSLMTEPHLPLDTILHKIVKLIQASWQYPEKTCARVIVGDLEVRTSNFRTTNYKQYEKVNCKKIDNVLIEVYYLLDKPNENNCLFLEGERNILKHIARYLREIIDTKYLTNELVDSEEKFSISFQKSPVAKCLLNKSDNFRFLDFNEKFITLTGLSREELEGKNLKDINFISEDVVQKQEDIKNFELAFLNKLGEYKTVLLSIETIKLKNIELALVVLNDITDWKRVENENRQNKNRLQGIIDNMQDAFFQADLSGSLRYINPMALQMFGYSSDEEMLGKSATILYANPQDREELIKILIQTGKVTDYTANALKKDGTTFWVSMNVQFVYDEEGNITGNQGIVRNITERIIYEEKLRDSEKRFRDIFENMPSGYILFELIFDENGKPIDHRLIEANAEFDNQTGTKREEELGRTSKEFSWKWPEDVTQRYYQVAITGKPFTYERFNDSLKRYYDIRVSSPKKGQFALLFNDITKRKETEKELIELLNRYKQIAKHLPGFIYQYHLQNDNSSYFPFASDGIKDIYGVTPEEVNKNAKVVFDAIHPDDLQKVVDSIFESAKNMTHWHESYRVILPSGNTIWVEGKSTPQKLEDGSVLWHGYIHDITKVKNYELSLIKAKEEAEESELKLNEAQALAKIGSWEWVIETDTVYWSDQLYNLTGRSKEKPAPPYAEHQFIYTAESFKKLDNAVSECLKNGTPYSIELDMVREDKTILPIFVIGELFKDANNNIIGLRGTVQDITLQKRIEKELINAKEKAEDSEKRLKLATLSGQLGIWDWNIKENSMLWDDRMFELYGIKNTTFTNNIDSWLNGLHPDDKEKAIEECNLALKNIRDFNTQFRALHPDGTVLFLKADGIVIRDNNNDPIRMIGINRDITDMVHAQQEIMHYKDNLEKLVEERTAELKQEIILRKETLTALKQSEEKYRNLVDHSTSLVLEWDTDGNIVFMNKYGLEFFGFSEEELINKNVLGTIVEPKDSEGENLEDKMQIVKKTPEAYYYSENENIKKTGEKAWVGWTNKGIFDETGKLIKTLSVGVDRTRQHELETAIKEYNITLEKTVEERTKELVIAKDAAEIKGQELNRHVHYLESLTNSLIDVVFTVNPENRKIRYVNKAIESIFGYSQEECIGLSTSILYSDEKDFVGFGEKLKETILNNEIYLKAELKLKRKNGESFDAEITTSFVKSDYEEIIDIISIVRDISEKTKSQNALIRAREKAEESDKLKSAFLLNISHEIRTPMNGILGFMGLLKEPDLSDAEKSEFIEIINKSGERLLSTINDIVEISKIEIGDIQLHFDDVNLDELMQFHYNFFSYQTKGKGLDFQLNNQVNRLIYTDKYKLDGILMNLIKNAIKFTDKGKIEIGSFLKDDYVHIYVSDTGRGIPVDKHKIIFDRFIQADIDLSRGYEGSGIGLSIVKSYVEALNGSIELESEVGKGSKFTVALPYRPAQKPSKIDIEEIPLKSLESCPILLIAEDDAVNFFYIEIILAKDFRLIHAKDGEEAINMFKDNPDISVILMDLKMPGKYDGIAATREIRKINKHIPIIAQTAFALDLNEMIAKESGFTDYISKPFKKDDLIRLIRKVMNQ